MTIILIALVIVLVLTMIASYRKSSAIASHDQVLFDFRSLKTDMILFLVDSLSIESKEKMIENRKILMGIDSIIANYEHSKNNIFTFTTFVAMTNRITNGAGKSMNHDLSDSVNIFKIRFAHIILQAYVNFVPFFRVRALIKFFYLLAKAVALIGINRFKVTMEVVLQYSDIDEKYTNGLNHS